MKRLVKRLTRKLYRIIIAIMPSTRTSTINNSTCGRNKDQLRRSSETWKEKVDIMKYTQSGLLRSNGCSILSGKRESCPTIASFLKGWASCKEHNNKSNYYITWQDDPIRWTNYNQSAWMNDKQMFRKKRKKPFLREWRDLLCDSDWIIYYYFYNKYLW